MSDDYKDVAFLALKRDAESVYKPMGEAVGLLALAPPLPGTPPVPDGTARKLRKLVGAAKGLLGLPLQLANTGFALATSPLLSAATQYLPPELQNFRMPPATLGSLYVGPPHGHFHPPSQVPPAVLPIPLPSVGFVSLGTCVKVLIECLPAARCGDIGFAPTCCGFVPAFEIKTGSSKVFIGGSRAARAVDICLECAPGTPSLGKLANALQLLGRVNAAEGIVANASEAVEVASNDPAMASAKAIAAALGAAQLAADEAAGAIKKALGKDVPAPPASGMLIKVLPSKVRIGGFPMVNIPFGPEKIAAKFKKCFPKRPSTTKAQSMEGTKTCGG